jgi:hypothetical protein
MITSAGELWGATALSSVELEMSAPDTSDGREWASNDGG